MAPSTLTRQLWALTALDAELGAVRLRRLDVDTIERALDRIATGRHGRGRPLTRVSVNRVRQALVAVLDLAMRRKAIAYNPARLAVVTPGGAVPSTSTVAS